MNHSHGFTITRGYVKIDFTPAWELNVKVIDFIFFSNKKSKQRLAHVVEEPKGNIVSIVATVPIVAFVSFVTKWS